ncbi:3-isopropylmalate dehydratase [Paenibacillus alvei]|uniref:3-isopropylmalate dehydratase n=1 Tax=Paenibacillus alvei TaxID=44250 RepID=A0ABT4H2G9_PAEAL|nr:3-isopropylmalate dehydratase [Paenibacillus alvei]MCY9763181.1 3-isopropylmalate dehydratase [Paenibacillus alvei]MCY9769530.1 3-isopropylmalate dehydratase [Paenibacillus alvei]
MTINQELLNIVQLKDTKFEMRSKLGYYKVNGHVLHHPEYGYVSFDGEVPYKPCGGREALQCILDDGGFVSFEGMHWVHEMKSST